MKDIVIPWSVYDKILDYVCETNNGYVSSLLVNQYLRDQYGLDRCLSDPVETTGHRYLIGNPQKATLFLLRWQCH